LSAVAVQWSPAERAAWEPPEKLLPSQWAERNRYLSRGQSSRFGKFKIANAPYIAGIMDLPFLFPRVRKINIIKAGQMAISEMIRCQIGYLADQEPDPCLLNLPDERSGKRIFGKRILPLFEETERLKALHTKRSRDMGLYDVALKNGFSLRLAWSGSDTSLASDPIRCVFNDEVNKFQRSAKEADPISLAEVRTATYGNSLIVNISTPTVGGEMIDVLYEGSPIKLFYFVPCPHCGKFHPWTWDRLRWEKFEGIADHKKKADAILKGSETAWYECLDCGKKIFDRHRAKALNKAYWGDEDDTFKLFVDGRIEGTLPDGDEVGIHVWAIYSLAAKHTFRGIAAEWVRCEGDVGKTQNFVNSWRGENFETQVNKTSSDEIEARKAKAPPKKLVPEWAGVVLATADTQKDYFVWVIRAWGYNYRSQLLEAGVSRSFEDLHRATLGSGFKVGGGDALIGARCLLIDSGGWKGAESANLSRTKEVYAFAANDPLRIFPTKGSSTVMNSPIARPTQLVGFPGVQLIRFDPVFFEDTLARLIQDADPTLWQVHNEVTADYCIQMAARHKIRDRRTRKIRWTTKAAGMADHYRSAEILQCVGADMANVSMMRPPEPPPVTAVPTGHEPPPKSGFIGAYKDTY
jgi:phage terminase large subunit GpA-like protein